MTQKSVPSVHPADAEVWLCGIAYTPEVSRLERAVHDAFVQKAEALFKTAPDVPNRDVEGTRVALENSEHAFQTEIRRLAYSSMPSDRMKRGNAQVNGEELSRLFADLENETMAFRNAYMGLLKNSEAAVNAAGEKEQYNAALHYYFDASWDLFKKMNAAASNMGKRLLDVFQRQDSTATIKDDKISDGVPTSLRHIHR